MTLRETVRGLSPEALRIFKQQLPERLKQLGELERNTALEQLRDMPELTPQQSVRIQRQTPRRTPLQTGLNIFGAPFQWIGKNVTEPFGAIVTAPFTPGLPGGREAGESPLAYARRQYEQWQEPTFTMPWGGKFRPTKGIIEALPWFAIPGIGGVAGKGIAGALGRLGTIGKITGTALEYSPWGLAEKAVGRTLGLAGRVVTPAIKKLIPTETARFVVPASEEIEKTITNMDWQRKVAQMFGRQPILKTITEKIGGRAATVTAAVEDTTARALLIGTKVRESLLSKGQVALASLRGINPNPVRLFGIDEVTQIAKGVGRKVEGASLHINDIAEHPANYILSKEQRNYIDQVHRVEDWVLDGLKEAKIDVKELKFDDFSHWVHREVIGKNIGEALTKVYKGGGRIGAKAGFMKTRFYEEAAEGVKAGILYEPSLERVVELYVQSASKMISDKRIAEMVSQFGEKPLERAMKLAPKTMAEAKETAYTLAGANRLVKVINSALRGEVLPEATLKAQERRFADLGARLRTAGNDKELLKTLLAEAKAVQESAKAPYWKAKAERAAVMEVARTPTLGTEATIWHPAFQGKIYPKDVAGEIQKYWDDVGFTPLNKLATLSGEMRTLVASADFSAMFIQGLPAIALHPKAWGAAAVMSFRAFKNPQYYQNYLVKETETLMERSHYGGYVGGFEFMEAMPSLQRTAGMITQLIAKKPALGKEAIRQTYGRFEASFGSFGDVARNEMWKALKGQAKNEQELMEIARHIDRMTGVMSSKGLGIGKTQRDFEQAFMFFAPRYTRAGFALVGDAFKGGITGNETRKALGSMMAAGALLYSGTAMALGQTPNFDPTSGKFMTIEITDPITGDKRHFGIGGMMTSLVRFGADVTASAIGKGQNEPLDFVKLNRFDNPFIKFMYSKSAPLTGFMEGLMFGHNYFGEPFENAGDYGKFLADQVLPIAVTGAFMEEGGLSPTAIAAQEAGLRTFPQSDWEKRDVLRNEISQKTYGMNWNDVGQRMGNLYQDLLEKNNPDLIKVTEKANETSSKLARGEGKVWNTWKNEGKDIETTYRRAIILASQEFEVTGNGSTFKDKVDDANKVRRAFYAGRERDPQFAEVYSYFNEPLEPSVIAKMNPKDLARREYSQMMYAPDMYDQFGNYNFDLADQKEGFFVQKYGQPALDYVQEYTGSKWDEPTPLKILREARSVLQPYWNIESQIWSQYPPQLRQISDQIIIMERTDPQGAKRMLFGYPQIAWVRKMIALQKRRLKLQNPQIAQALNLFY